MEVPALIISALALLFTVVSFWWMNWRRGKLIVGAPSTYAAVAIPQDRLVIVQLPLVFYNDGAAARIVQNLRLQLEKGGEVTPILHFNNTAADLASPKERKWSRQFAVEGRKSHAAVFVFQTKPTDFIFSAGTWKAKLEGKVDRRKRWETILEFDFHVSEDKLRTLNSSRLIPYDNELHHDRENPLSSSSGSLVYGDPLV